MEERRVTDQVNGHDQYDPARLLTVSALIFVGILILFVAGIIGAQIAQSGEANTESWAALTGLIGWATSQVSIIFSNRYGTTQQSTNQTAVIAQQARAATVLAQAAAAPAPTPPAAAEQPGGGVTTSPATTGVSQP